jgi:O-antigen/teichoic acid export membrane protein
MDEQQQVIPLDSSSNARDRAAPASDAVSALDRSLVTGIGWTAVFRWGAQLVSWAATLYAVRVLSPGDYDLIAMAMVPIGLARMVEDFGLDTVLVQDRLLTDDQLRRLAGFAIVLGLGLALLFSALSPLAAAFFRQDELRAAIPVLSALFVFDALQVLPRALLQRELQFRRLALVYAVQYVATSVVLVTLTALGFGYWALVLNTLAGSLCATVALVLMHPFAVSWPRGIRSISGSLMSGWRILVSRGAWYGYSNLDLTFIGRALGKDALGAYSFAQTMAKMLLEEITVLVGRVVPGIFSTVQRNPALLRRYFLLLTEAVSYPAFPIAVGTTLIADSIVRVLLGEQWLQVIEPLRLLGVYWVFYAAQIVVAPVLVWTGKFRATMWLNLLGLVVLPLGFLVGLQWGLAGVAWAWVIGFPLATLPSFLIARPIMELRWSEYFAALLPAGTACVAMSAVVTGARAVLPASVSPVVELAVLAGAGATAYGAVLALCFRQRLLRIVELIRASRAQGPSDARAVSTAGPVAPRPG